MEHKKRIPLNIIIGIFSIGLSLLMLGVVWGKLGVWFETNDDKFITEILSGSLGGRPDAHVVYVNYLLTLPLSLLYRILPHIPWYGGMLLLFHVLVYVSLFWSILSRAKNKIELIFLIGVIGCYALINIYITVLVQYTSVAVLLATAGYALLLIHFDEKRGILLFFLFELFSFLLREQAMLMIQPLGYTLCVGLYLVSKDKELKTKLHKIGYLTISIVAIVLIGSVGSWIGYGDSEWKDYHSFNESRTTLFDYYGNPPYEEVKPILDKYQVTPVAYYAFCGHAFLDWGISVECIQELEQYVLEHAQKSLDVSSMLSTMWDSENGRAYMGILRLVEALWGAAILCVLLFRRFYLLTPLTGLLLGRIAVWAYLIFEGRMPGRVTYPLLSCEALLLIILLVKDYMNGNNSVRWRFFAVISLIVCGFFCYIGGREQYRIVRQDALNHDVYMEGLVEVQDYCRSHPDKRYLLDCWSFSHYRGSVLETRIYEEQNSLPTASWYSGSPVMRKYLKEYLEGNEDCIYLIVYNNGQEADYYAVQYMAEKLGKTPVLNDEFTVSSGVIYLIWGFL